MEYKKDTKGTTATESVSNTGMASFSVALSKKCERLATAVYLVTNFLSDKEPLKFRLRTLSIDFVRDASFVKNGSHSIELNVLKELLSNIEETLSLLELAFIAGLVSEMNFTILKREYVSLRGTIEVKKVSRESHTDSILGDNFFGTTTTLRAGTIPQSQVMNTFSKGHSIGQIETTMSDTNVKFLENKPVQKTDKRQESVNIIGQTKQPKSIVRATTDIAKESRRMRILKLVKDNREVTIKDITTHFPELSEKTIQRELVSLVESGVLKKFGERRWSRYTLV